MDMQIVTSKSKINFEKHFKVIAGPGAGKTKFLIGHIKNVLHNSNRLGRNRKIACITYTNVGVETILKRLGDESDHVEVSTIHSFLFYDVIKPYLYLISDKYEINLMKVDSPYEHIVSKGYFSKTDLGKKNIQESEMKEIFWRIDGADCYLHIKGRKRNFHQSLLKYKKMFWNKGIIHYDDVLAFSWEILNSYKFILRVLRSKFPYFFIDEFQDTNPIQTEIIKIIAKKETIVGVIGDRAQSIYEFHGADVKQFNDFKLDDMIFYKIEDNHRSTEQIIKILNYIRSDLSQSSPKKKTGNIPIIFVGKPLQVLQHVQNLLGGASVHTLSYSNLTANSIRNNWEYDGGQSWIPIDESYKDSNRDRRKLFISIIKAIEYARLSNYTDAIKQISRNLRMFDEHSCKKITLLVINTLLNDYNEYSEKTLWTLYEKVLKLGLLQFPKIRESRNEKEPSDIEFYYKNTKYSSMALLVKISEDNSIHRTIHKAKGSEFENVLVIVKGKDNHKYNEERDFGFLLNPDLDGNVDHRVNYVACSRAMQNLYICVPDLSTKAKNKLMDYFEIITIATQS